MQIELMGVQIADDYIIRTAMTDAELSAKDKIHYDYSLRSKGYSPYLVKVVERVQDSLRFRGVALANPSSDFGPDPSDPMSCYEVDLGQLNDVYREMPSVLSGLDETHSYTVLFLSREFVSKDAHLALVNATQDGPKWPAGAGEDYEQLLAAYKALQNENQRLAYSNRQMQAQYDYMKGLYEAKRNAYEAVREKYEMLRHGLKLNLEQLLQDNT